MLLTINTVLLATTKPHFFSPQYPTARTVKGSTQVDRTVASWLQVPPPPLPLPAQQAVRLQTPHAFAPAAPPGSPLAQAPPAAAAALPLPRAPLALPGPTRAQAEAHLVRMPAQARAPERAPGARARAPNLRLILFTTEGVLQVKRRGCAA